MNHLDFFGYFYIDNVVDYVARFITFKFIGVTATSIYDNNYIFMTITVTKND